LHETLKLGGSKVARPIQGRQYTAQSGDTLRSIASEAYGLSENWTLIRDANQFSLKTDNLESVSEGETILIPVDPDIQNLKDEQSLL
jgi:nucleoid-associated protein YgaU